LLDKNPASLAVPSTSAAVALYAGERTREILPQDELLIQFRDDLTNGFVFQREWLISHDYSLCRAYYAKRETRPETHSSKL